MSKKLKIVAITNQKGGVGKTTTTVNLATALVSLGEKVLIIDLDPQGNSTSGFGIDKSLITKSIYNVLLNEIDLKESFKTIELKENKKLTPKVVNTQTGRWLHTFGWLPDKEADIGRIPEEWNWLDGHSDPELNAKNVT